MAKNATIILMNEPSFVYNMSNMNRNVLYIGVTSELEKYKNNTKAILFMGLSQTNTTAQHLYTTKNFPVSKRQLAAKNNSKPGHARKKINLLKL